MSQRVDADGIRERRGGWRSGGRGRGNQGAEIDFAERGGRWSLPGRGDLKNPKAAVGVIDNDGNVKIFVDRNAGGDTAGSGTDRNTSGGDLRAEQSGSAGMHIDKLDGTGTGFGYNGNTQDAIERDGAGRGTGGQRNQNRSSVGLVGIPGIRIDGDVGVSRRGVGVGDADRVQTG